MSKKKILLLADDLRMHSGVARMSRDMVLGTLHKYDWAQIAGAVKHPEEGKRIMMQGDENFKIPKDSKCTLYPVSGYGNPDKLREIMEIEKPDALCIYTDPRFWIWFFQMENEIRQKIPIFYYNIWDDLPDPIFNRNYYRSCDLLMAISKQTYGINKRLLPEYDDWQITYVPHGINEDMVFKIKEKSFEFTNFESKMGLDKYKFKILYCNRNIRRKMPGDVVMAYKHFMDKLTEEQRKDCCLIFHTAPVDENGTDLREVCSALIPNYNVVFTYDRNKGVHFNDKEMNFIYNTADITINIASNEGFGLATAESLMTGTPIIVNVTGGLQDQCGFMKDDGSLLTIDDYSGDWGSNNNGKYQKHGEWVKPVFPSTISLQGSPPTPYIFDDRSRWDEVGDAIKEWYDVGHDERVRCGELGIEFVKNNDVGMSGKGMSKNFLDSFDNAFANWKPRRKYILEAV
tara:strand:+ start:1383 stop:2756 length:1374 start_codon:yes stop_codon:yes gene_type:complete